MNRQLVVIAGPDKGRAVPLPSQGKLALGRGQASDVKLQDPRISRVHCTIEVTATGVILADAGSTGGTYVDGKRVERHRLAEAGEFQIGDSRLVFRQVGAEREAAKPKQAVRISAKSLDDLAGQRLGHFHLERVLRKGESSVMFLAKDEKQSCPAAVKVMLPNVMRDEEQRSRFVRAVHTMINVRHPNLVEIYGAGKQGPFCWCAMEYVDGISVLEMIELIGMEGRLDWRDVFRIGVHVARALECAHRNKVIHRNVTPDNLLQRKNDKVVKLCDLMLAKALEGTQANQVTAPGQLIGNVSYMSPERIADTSSLDWRSDQYGLGATIFALLTGNPPFQSNGLVELVKQIRTADPAFPDDVRGDTPERFTDAVLKMLAKSPADRFAYPSELISELDEIGKQGDVDADALFNN